MLENLYKKYLEEISGQGFTIAGELVTVETCYKCVYWVSKIEKKFIEVILVDVELYIENARNDKYEESGFSQEVIVFALEMLDDFLNEHLSKDNIYAVKSELSTWLDNKFKYEVVKDANILKNEDIICINYFSPDALGDYGVITLMNRAGKRFRFEYLGTPYENEIISYCEAKKSSRFCWHDVDDGCYFIFEKEYKTEVLTMYNNLLELSIFFMWHGMQMLDFIRKK